MTELSSEISEAVYALPARVQPMLDYAKQIEPNAIVVCDRDARPIGQVFEKLAREDPDYQGPAPRYKRISKRMGNRSIALVAEHCQDLADYLKDLESPAKIMVIDDYVSSKAGTIALFRAAMHRLALDADIHWTTLAGRGTALNVVPYAGPSIVMPWRDRQDIIGIDYDGIIPHVVDTPLSRDFSDLLSKSVDMYLAGSKTASLTNIK